ncbi:hypothetical protein B0H11DRAFT_783626 [Mycena galericulata]|nr:hypothetical protein B0H11DRAFT_783626 [Mycena galericulata]
MATSLTSSTGPASSVPSSPSSSSPPPPTSSSAPSSPPPTSSSTTTTTSSSSVSSTATSSSAPSSTSSASSIPATTSASNVVSTGNSVSLQLSTGTGGGVVTLTHTVPITQTGAPTASSSANVDAATKGFFQNKAAVGATFAIVGLVAAGILFAFVTNALRRRRARRFDREIAEEAKRAPAPVFVDDEDYNSNYHSDPYTGGGYGAAPIDGFGNDSYGAHGGDPYTVADGAAGAGYAPSASDALSSGVHSNPGGGGTPSNYMYPSGYSDLGFSDVSSHGTYAQPPMEGQYPHAGGYAGYGAAGIGAAGMAAAVGAGAGAYEMTGYHNGQVAQQGQDWHGYAYGGEDRDAAAAGYPPTATTAHSSGSDVLARSKSGAARSLVDSYNTGGSGGAVGGGGGAGGKEMPQYADGYVSQYQTHVEDGTGAYGGLESMHGHVGGMEEDESDREEEGDGRRVLKVANE